MTVTLVCGPPCVGKSRWVEDRAASGDMVVDRDVIAVGLGSPRSHNHHADFVRAADAVVDDYLDQLRLRSVVDVDAWVIRSAPSSSHRAEVAAEIGADDVVVLLEPRELLVERAQSRPNPEATVRLIDWWLAKHAEDVPFEPSVWLL